MAMRDRRFSSGRRVGHPSRYYNGELNHGRSVKFYSAWVDIIEMHEWRGLMAPILKAISSVDAGKVTYNKHIVSLDSSIKSEAPILKLESD